MKKCSWLKYEIVMRRTVYPDIVIKGRREGNFLEGIGARGLGIKPLTGAPVCELRDRRKHDGVPGLA